MQLRKLGTWLRDTGQGAYWLSRVLAEPFLRRLGSLKANPWRLVAPRRLPGWLTTAIGYGPKLAEEYFEHVRNAFDIARELGGEPRVLIDLITSNWYANSLLTIGVLYVIFIGEPHRGVLRHPAWRIIGWSVAGLCLAGVTAAGFLAAAQVIYVAGEGQGERKIQQQALGSPIYWHMTTDEKAKLGMALDKIKEEDRLHSPFGVRPTQTLGRMLRIS